GDVREAVDLVARGLDDAGDGRVIRDVAREHNNIAAGVVGGEVVEALLRDVDRDHATTLARDSGCRGTPDTRSGTRHDHGLSSEAAIVEALFPDGTLDLLDLVDLVGSGFGGC